MLCCWFQAGLSDEKFGAPVAGGVPRRSVYVNVVRNRLDPFLAVYDAPVPFSATGRRAETNVPAQSLTMLNNPFVVQAAARFAEGSRGKKDEQRIAEMWKAALGREVSKSELRAAESFVKDLRQSAEQMAQSRAAMQKRLSGLQASRAEILNPVRSKLEQELKGEKQIDQGRCYESEFWRGRALGFQQGPGGPDGRSGCGTGRFGSHREWRTGGRWSGVWQNQSYRRRHQSENFAGSSDPRHTGSEGRGCDDATVNWWSNVRCGGLCGAQRQAVDVRK